MPLTPEQLCQIMPGKLVKPPGLKWDPSIMVFFHYPHLETDWGDIRLLVNLIDEGRLLQFRSINLFMLSDNQRVREQQIEIILANNYNKKSVKFAHDPEDGEVCLFVDIPVLDNERLSRKLMERLLASIRISGGNILRELKSTVENGPIAAKEAPPREKPSWMRNMLRKGLRLLYGKWVD